MNPTIIEQNHTGTNTTIIEQSQRKGEEETSNHSCYTIIECGRNNQHLCGAPPSCLLPDLTPAPQGELTP